MLKNKFNYDFLQFIFDFMCLPGLTVADMVLIDDLMMNKLRVPVELMMEHAGLNLARFAITHFSSSRFLVVSGPGNNGGGGLVAARRLCSWGNKVTVVVPNQKAFVHPITSKQIKRARELGCELFTSIPETHDAQDTVLIDAYLGYNFKPRKDYLTTRVFEWLHSFDKILSLDAPSGYDLTTGENHSGIKASYVLTIAFVKQGLFNLPEHLLDRVYVVDIGVPKMVFQESLGYTWEDPYSLTTLDRLYSFFSKSPLVKAMLHVNHASKKYCWTPLLV